MYIIISIFIYIYKTHTLQYPNIPFALLQVPYSSDILFSICQHNNYLNISNLFSSESVFYRHHEKMFHQCFKNTGSLIYCHNLNGVVVLMGISFET